MSKVGLQKPPPMMIRRSPLNQPGKAPPRMGAILSYFGWGGGCPPPPPRTPPPAAPPGRASDVEAGAPASDVSANSDVLGGSLGEWEERDDEATGEGASLWLGYQENFEERFAMQPKLLGSGRFGKVWLATDKEVDASVAVKVLDKAQMQTRRVRARHHREVSLWLALSDARHVVRLVSLYEDRKSVMLVMGTAAGGDLFELLERHPGGIPEADAREYLRQLLEALEDMHSRRIAHRDLKPENLLLTADNKLLVSDFGLSGFLKSGHFEDLAGTPYYLAPEDIKREGCLASDIWSAGVILHIALVGFPPFWGNTDSEVIGTIMKDPRVKLGNPRWAGISLEAKDILQRMMEVDPSRRITAREALRHSWLSGGRARTPLPVSTTGFAGPEAGEEERAPWPPV